MNVLENDEESLVETGSHRRPFDDQLGWPTMSEPAPVLQHPSSTPQGDYTHTELLRDCAHTHLQLPPNDLSGVSRLYYTNVSLEDATAEFLDVADSSFDPPSGHQDPTEGVSLPALCDLCPLGFCPTFDGHDPSPTEGSAFPSASRYFEGTSHPPRVCSHLLPYMEALNLIASASRRPFPKPLAPRRTSLGIPHACSCPLLSPYLRRGLTLVNLAITKRFPLRWLSVYRRGTAARRPLP
ncbi:hypothetical protein EDB83DRAFT_1410202 [Lactarius deliciosus]|nr:hypothetical protein EDB83DRAFT_1410202 [Lactarius deliciosus]